jgi:hypothetical protein
MTAEEPPLYVEFGSHVTIELIDEQGHSETMSFDIVNAHAADLERGWLGENTPLARAIMGQAVGQEVAYRQGDIQRVRILSVEPAQSRPSSRVEERQAALKKAQTEAERTNAEMFASSFSGKWGDYDPEGMAGWE